ncbi:unnamed protein product [Citrullus colocynthis]|uniref:Uncharacterized protein n=1 Tax=Citrullus colocynthis TaxID=252529 RepID=A0ABP0YGL9_9ROSI
MDAFRRVMSSVPGLDDHDVNSGDLGMVGKMESRVVALEEKMHEVSNSVEALETKMESPVHRGQRSTSRISRQGR